MPYFSEANLEQLSADFVSVTARAERLRENFVARHYNSEIATEYAHHGVARRLDTLAHCISQVFEQIPPENHGIPEKDIRLSATVFIQAFIFNAYGVLDNLAFIWVNERDVRKRNGQKIPIGRIGLNNDEVRQSFSQEMQDYLRTRDDWFGYLENFRHALGHRISLYIPPYLVDPENADRYREIEVSMNTAIYRNHDPAEFRRLEAEQIALCHFMPLMKHSFTDPTPPVVFHPQILADFATIEEICQQFLIELDRR